MGDDRFSKEEIDRITKWNFHGLEDAARLMRKRPPNRSLVGRWDWHFWMFVVTTCLPCFGLYCLAMWVRAGLWKKHEEREAAKKRKLASTEASPTIPSHSQIITMEQEIQKLKILLQMQGKGLPSLSSEAWQRIFDSGKKTEVAQSEKSPPSKEKEKKDLSFSDRVWNSVKPWLPFYVEPFFEKRVGPPPMTDFRRILKEDPDS